MDGAKALALEQYCRRTGRACVRFDYSGHGESGGVFEDCTLTDWIGDALCVLDSVTQAPQVVVGSSMGGWVMLTLALRRAKRVAGLVGVAAAPDFTEDLLPDALDDEAHRQLRETGVWRPSGLDGEETAVTQAFLESGRAHVVLKDAIPIRVPVRLLHGTDDLTVPWQRSLRLLERLESADVTLTLLKDGAHRLSEPPELEVLVRTLDALLARLDPG